MGTRRCPPPACHLQGVAQPVFSNIQKSFSALLRGAGVIQNLKGNLTRRIFYQFSFSIFALMVFKFFCCHLVERNQVKLTSRKLLTNFNNYCSWPWTHLRKLTYDMYEYIVADFFSCLQWRVHTGKIDQHVKGRSSKHF